MNTITMGRRINNARKERGITGEKLSELCCINATYLRQIESGRKTPSLPVFVEICRQLKVSPNYLLREELPDNEYSDIPMLAELLQTADPEQLRIITAMVKSAIQTMQSREEPV